MENRFKIAFEFQKFQNTFEILPAITWHTQLYAKRFEKGNLVICWLKYAIVIYGK